MAGTWYDFQGDAEDRGMTLVDKGEHERMFVYFDAEGDGEGNAFYLTATPPANMPPGTQRLVASVQSVRGERAYTLPVIG